MVIKKIRLFIVPAVVITGILAALIYGLSSGDSREIKRELHNSSQAATVTSASSLPESSDTCSRHEWVSLYKEEYVKTSDAVMSATVICEICGENLGEAKTKIDKDDGFLYWTETSSQYSHIRECFLDYCNSYDIDPYSQDVDKKTSTFKYSPNYAVWEKQNTSTLIGYECSKCGEIVPAE